MSKPTWIGQRPPNADSLDEVIDRVASANAPKGPSAVRLRRMNSAWFVEGARKGATGSESSGPAFDLRPSVTEALRKAGVEVVGVEAVAEPLSPSREEAIRLAVKAALQGAAPSEGALFDVQVVADLVGEVDRLRGKLHQAALARDLTSRAASNLRDACDDIRPKPVRFRKASKDPND